jgi:adenylate kinase
MNFIMLGPQGSGKGTQAEFLAARFKIPTVSTGALYRENIKRKTKLGKLAEKFTQKGVLGPNYLTNKMMKAELVKAKYKKGVILDGYPRSMNQAKFLDKLFKVDLAILIDISQKETIRRLSKRRVCSQCGQTYHLEFKRPNRFGLCDKCKGKLIQRLDDFPKAIKKRLKVYQKQTKPILDYYQKQGKLIKINGHRSINKVFSSILKKLKNKGFIKF